MQTEWEAKFLNIDKKALREKLKLVGAKLVKPETLYKRSVFTLPKSTSIEGGWLRIRDEGDKITMSSKVTINGKIETQKEVMLKIDNFENAKDFLTSIGCIEKAYQETKRELWELDEVEITIDEWPFLDPFTEIEGKSEEEVKIVAEKLGFNYEDAIFGGVDQLYAKKYGVAEDVVNNKTPLLVFSSPNPFVN